MVVVELSEVIITLRRKKYLSMDFVLINAHFAPINAQLMFGTITEEAQVPQTLGGVC